MLRNKISDNIEGIVKYLLTKKYLYYVIRQQRARMNLNVLKSHLSRITNKIGKQQQLCLLNSEKPKFHCCRHIIRWVFHFNSNTFHSSSFYIIH